MYNFAYLVYGSLNIPDSDAEMVFNWLKEVYPEATNLNDGHGDNVDAMRHGGIASVLAYKVGYDLAIKIGRSNEAYTPGPALEDRQDHYNNEVGARLGSTARILGLDYSELGELVKNAYKNNLLQLDSNNVQSGKDINLGNGIVLTKNGEILLSDGGRIVLSNSLVVEGFQGIPDRTFVTIIHPDGSQEKKILDDVSRLEIKREIFGNDAEIKSYCFAAGTFISMADGVQKSIEMIEPGDTVMSFDATADNGRGALVPGKVVRLFRNHAPHMLDFHGTRVTPGHAYLCGDGPHEGRFRQLIDIIRDDGAVVKADGTLMRAATGCTVGSRGDTFVDLEVLRIGHDRRTGAEIRHVEARGLVRAGTTLTDETGLSYTLLGLLDAKGWKLQPDGLIVQAPGRKPAPLRSLLPALPKPEDYVLARSGLTLADVYDDLRQDERPSMPVARAETSDTSTEPGILHASAPCQDTTHAAGSGSTVSGPSRKARRKAEAEQRKQGRVGAQARATLH